MEVEVKMKKYIGYKQYSNISHIELWINQRDPNQNLIDKIVKDQIEYYKKYKEFTFPGALVVVHFNNKEYLIDGQHRFRSLEILYNKHKYDIEVAVQIYVCDDKKQVDELYCMLNQVNTNNCMVVNGNIDPDGEKLKQIKMMLYEKYGNKIWVDKKTTKPYVSTISLDEELKKSLFFNLKTALEIITDIEKKNDDFISNLKNKNKADYEKAMSFGGFALSYKEPSARWVRALFSK
jgi:hypothetical protein